MNGWLLARIALLAFVAISSFFVPLGQQASPPLSWQALGVIFVFCPVALVIVLGLQTLNPRSAGLWHKPSWSLNPFNFKEPVQFFHLGAYVFIIQGTVTLARATASQAISIEVLVPLAMGMGILVGLEVCRKLFRSKFAAQPGAAPDP